MTHPFDSLLTDPPGQYALTPFGNTHAVVLTGCPTFQRRAYNLFVSRGCDGIPPPPVHDSLRLNTVWFCLPEERVRLALALYLYGQLVRANTRDVIDEEGDFVEVICDNEPALWDQAEQLACDFMVNHMPRDWRALPSYESDDRIVEHGVGTISGGEE